MRAYTIDQPQHLSATIVAVAKAEFSDCTGQDLLAGPSDREIALAGPSAIAWGQHFYSVFSRDFWLEWRPRVEDSSLRRYGLEDPVTNQGDESKRLHRQGLVEIGARGAHQDILSWLDNGARGKLPSDVPRHDRWPGVKGFTQYFQRNYAGQ